MFKIRKVVYLDRYKDKQTYHCKTAQDYLTWRKYNANYQQTILKVSLINVYEWNVGG